MVWFVIDFFSSLACYWHPVHVDHPRNKVLLKNSAADEFIAECIFACDQPSGECCEINQILFPFNRKGEYLLINLERLHRCDS